jgi:hypothetical protein
MCAGNYSQVHPLLLPRHVHSSALPLLLALYSHVFEPGVLLSHTSLLQAIDVWSVGCVLAELYQLFKSDNRSFRPFFYGTIKLGPGEREGGPVAAALCSRILVELFCDADSQCAQAELLLKTIFSIIGDVTVQLRVLFWM